MPAVIGQAKLAESLSVVPNNQPIGELEHLLQGKDPATVLVSPLPVELAQTLNEECFALGIIPTRVIGQAQIKGLIDAVRNIVLEWSLKLESEGILGEGMSFSEEEQVKAASATYQIQNFSGVLGNVQAHTIQIGDYNSIHAELKRLGISQVDRTHLEQIMDRFIDAKGKEKEGLAKQGLEWVLAHAEELGALAEVIRGWFQG